jgi:hypothetical protein
MKQTRGATGGTAVRADVLSLGVLEKHFTPEGAHRRKHESQGNLASQKLVDDCLRPVFAQARTFCEFAGRKHVDPSHRP